MSRIIKRDLLCNSAHSEKVLFHCCQEWEVTIDRCQRFYFVLMGWTRHWYLTISICHTNSQIVMKTGSNFCIFIIDSSAPSEEQMNKQENKQDIYQHFSILHLTLFQCFFFFFSAIQASNKWQSGLCLFVSIFIFVSEKVWFFFLEATKLRQSKKAIVLFPRWLPDCDALSFRSKSLMVSKHWIFEGSLHWSQSTLSIMLVNILFEEHQIFLRILRFDHLVI